MNTKRITKDAILLALMCVTGMLSIPLGENIKVSLQLLSLFIIFIVADELFDRILIPALYLLIGLFAPFYAGMIAGITPTFGFVISFVVIAPIFHYTYRYLPIKNIYLRYVLTCLLCLIVVYIIGTIFMMLYLNMDLGKTLLIAVVPYIGFDIAKIIIATVVLKFLPPSLCDKTR